MAAWNKYSLRYAIAICRALSATHRCALSLSETGLSSGESVRVLIPGTLTSVRSWSADDFVHPELSDELRLGLYACSSFGLEHASLESGQSARSAHLPILTLPCRSAALRRTCTSPHTSPCFANSSLHTVEGSQRSTYHVEANHDSPHTHVE